jgi:hypothetical protein
MRINSLEIETVTLRDGVIHPDRIRERIRAEGPTIRYGAAEYAALGEARR